MSLFTVEAAAARTQSVERDNSRSLSQGNDSAGGSAPSTPAREAMVKEDSFEPDEIKNINENNLNVLRSVLERTELNSNQVGIEFTSEELQQCVLCLLELNLVVIKTRRYHLRFYSKCFVGRHFVDSIVSHPRTKLACKERLRAVKLMNCLMRAGLVHHVCDDHEFKDDYLFYRFYADDMKLAVNSNIVTKFSGLFTPKNRSSSRSTSGSLEKSQGHFDRSSSGGSDEALPLNLSELPDMGKLAKHVRANIVICDRQYHLKMYHNVFLGTHLVNFFIDSNYVENRAAATLLGRALWTAGHFHHVHDDHQFSDRDFFYRFYQDEDESILLDSIQWLKARKPAMPQNVHTPLKVLGNTGAMSWRITPHVAHNSIILDSTMIGASNVSFGQRNCQDPENHCLKYTLRHRALHLLGKPEIRSKVSSKQLISDDSALRGSWVIQPEPGSGPEKTGNTARQVDSVQSYLSWERVSSVSRRTIRIDKSVGSRSSSAGGSSADSWMLTSEESNGSSGDMSMLNKQDRTPIVLKRVQNVESKKIGRYLHSLLGAHAHGERNDWLLDGEEEILEDMTEGTQKEREVADTQEDLHSILNETGEQKIVYRKEISSNMLIPNSHMTLLRDIFRIETPSLSNMCGLPVGTIVVYEVSVEHIKSPTTQSSSLSPAGASPTGPKGGESKLDPSERAVKEVFLSAYAVEPSVKRSQSYAAGHVNRVTFISQMSVLKRVKGMPLWLLQETVRQHPLFDTMVERDKEALKGAKSVYVKKKSLSNVNLNDFEIMAVLGRGGYGKVLQVRLKSAVDNAIFAMKTLKRDQFKDDEQRERVILEREILTDAHHPFIASLEYAFHTSTKLYMVMEFISGGDFFTHIHSAPKTGFTTNRIKQHLAEIVLAVHHLHRNYIIYRDLKPENILLDGAGHAKLVDFGLSYRGKAGKPLRTTSFCGTEKYMAPEQLLNRPYESSVDWWSLGLLVAEMTSGGKHPFRGKTRLETCRNVVQRSPKYRRSFMQPISKQIVAVMDKFLQKLPINRLGYGSISSNEGLTNIKDMDLFRGVSWNDVLQKKVPLEFMPDTSGNDLKYFDDEFTSERPVDSYIPPPKTASQSWQFLNLFKSRSSQAKKRDSEETVVGDEFEGFDYQPKKSSTLNIAKESN
eukprot:g5610.t1